jgi:hypothetical protein
VTFKTVTNSLKASDYSLFIPTIGLAKRDFNMKRKKLTIKVLVEFVGKLITKESIINILKPAQKNRQNNVWRFQVTTLAGSKTLLPHQGLSFNKASII